MHSELEPNKFAWRISLGKVEAVVRKHKNAIVIAADTFIIFGGQILGKPNTKKRPGKC